MDTLTFHFVYNYGTSLEPHDVSLLYKRIKEKEKETWLAWTDGDFTTHSA